MLNRLIFFIMCVLRKIYLFSECHDIATVIVLTRSLTEKVRRRNTREVEVGHTQERQGRKDLGRDQDQRIEGKSDSSFIHNYTCMDVRIMPAWSLMPSNIGVKSRSIVNIWERFKKCNLKFAILNIHKQWRANI